jgi:hypothetical protein
LRLLVTEMKLCAISGRVARRRELPECESNARRVPASTSIGAAELVRRAWLCALLLALGAGCGGEAVSDSELPVEEPVELTPLLLDGEERRQAGRTR